MILFPAIDLKDGACVRLLRGDMDAATVFNDSPSDQARAFVEAGAAWLHIVDLNGAFDGQSVNGDAVRGILDVTRAAEDLTLAARNALIELIDYLVKERGLTREQAYVLCSVAADLVVGQVVDVPNYTVSAIIDLEVFEEQ